MSKYIILILLFCLINNAICASDTTQVSKTELETVTVLSKKHKLKKYNMDKKKVVFSSTFAMPLNFLSNSLKKDNLLISVFEKDRSKNKFYVDYIFIKMKEPNMEEFKKSVELHFVGGKDTTIISSKLITYDTFYYENDGIKLVVKENFFFEDTCNRYFLKLQFLDNVASSSMNLKNQIFFGNYFKNERNYIAENDNIKPFSIYTAFLEYYKINGPQESIFVGNKAINLKLSISYATL